MTAQEIAIQVLQAQRNQANDAAMQVAVEANMQRERADALQKELDELKKSISKPRERKSKSKPEGAMP